MKILLKYLPPFLVTAGFLTFVFGPKYAVSQIPIEARSRMGDFDWIGVEWIAAGVLLMVAGLVAWLIASFWKDNKTEN